MLFGSKKGGSSKKSKKHTAYTVSHSAEHDEHTHHAAKHPAPPEHKTIHHTPEHHHTTHPHHTTHHSTHTTHSKTSHKHIFMALGAVLAIAILGLLFLLNARMGQILWFQNTYMGPAFEEFSLWSQARGLIQPTHVHTTTYMLEDGIKIEENLELRGLQGPSMEPSIFPGNTLLLRPVTEKTAIREGHIIRFNYEDSTYVHRVLAAYDDKIITQGDNSLTQETISREDITHIVIGVLYT